MRFIFDLDMTLIDSSHRQLTREDGSIDIAHWRANSTREKIMQDTLLPLANELRFSLNSLPDVLACTSRVMTRADFEYLRVHGLRFDTVLHRGSENNTLSCGEHKERELRAYFAENDTGERTFRQFARRSIVFDDSKRVLAHLKGLGFRCYDAVSINERLSA